LRRGREIRYGRCIRSALVIVTALLGLACTGDRAEPPAARAHAAVPATPTPAPAVPATPTPAPAVPTTPATVPVPPTLQAGPDRYQLPATVRGACDGGGGGSFCGVYIIELADGKITTLLTRDGAAWWVRSGKTETPTVAEFVTLPAAPGRVERVPQTMQSPPGTHLEFSPPLPILATPLDFPDLIGLSYALVNVGDKLYGAAGLPEPRLTEIDLKAGTYRWIDLPGRQVLEVHPAGDVLALYLARGGKTWIATFDLATQKLVADIALPRGLAPECRRSKNSLHEQAVVALPQQGRIYVEYSCHPDG